MKYILIDFFITDIVELIIPLVQFPKQWIKCIIVVDGNEVYFYC